MHRGKKIIIIVIILLCKFHEIKFLCELVVSGVKGRGPKMGCDH